MFPNPNLSNLEMPPVLRAKMTVVLQLFFVPVYRRAEASIHLDEIVRK